MLKNNNKLILVFGDNAGRHESSSLELLDFLQKTRDVLGEDELRNQFQLSQRSFATNEEKIAFINGIVACEYEHEDIAIIEDNLHTKELLDLFGQSHKNDSPSFRTQIDSITRHLKEMTESGWIPFASPAPSSTEAALKREVLAAIDHLEKAGVLCR